MNRTRKPKIIIIAGEPSGDLIGAQLIKSLKKRLPNAYFYGVGGGQMIQEGLHPFLSVAQLSIMGITEALTKIFTVYKHLTFVSDEIRAVSPDVVITIDFPGFNFRLAKILQGCGVPLIHYVAPTVWAWRPKRAEKISKLYTHLLMLFPFEAPYFEKEKLPATFVGHPLVEMPYAHGDGQRFRNTHGINSNVPLLCLLPGSRVSEVNRLMPVFKIAAEKLSKCHSMISGNFDIQHGYASYASESMDFASLEIVIPTIAQVQSIVEIQVKHWSIKAHLVTSFEEKVNAYAACSGAIAASGTVSLELAQAGLPHLIAYKVSWLNAALLRAQIKIPYVCMVNILLDKFVVPELLQEKCTPDDIYHAAVDLFFNPAHMKSQKENFKDVIRLLTPPQDVPSNVAADVVQSYIS